MVIRLARCLFRRVTTAIVLAVGSIAVAGCVGTTGVLRLDTPILTEGQKPAIGAIASTPVGGTVLTDFRFWRSTRYRLTASTSFRLALGRVEAPAGSELVRGHLNGLTVYCTVDRAYIDPLVGPTVSACFIDPTDSGAFSTATAHPGTVWLQTDIPSPVGYERFEHVAESKESLKYELLYQGVSSNVLRLTYREFIKDMARPAYYQDVTYELRSFPTTVSFKTVNLEILSADNRGMSYRVLSGFR